MKDVLTLNEMDHTRDHDGYEQLLVSIRDRFYDLATKGVQLYTTDAGGLYDIFLDHIPEEARQHYNCNACRHFVNRYGGLVGIDLSGALHPVMWADQEGFFAEAIEAVRRVVKRANVTGVFVTSEKRLGTPVTGSWHHMAVNVPVDMRHRDRLRTAYQVAAEKAEDYKMLGRAIGMYKWETVRAAVNLLRSESLYRGEKVRGVAEWLLGVHHCLGAANNSWARRNLMWHAVATAPAGFCHVSSTMIGTLLDDIAAGLDMDTVRRKFAEKMNPTQYQRPKAAPTAGNIEQAEKIVERLGIANSLRRRFARLEELQLLWKPAPQKQPAGGVFGHLKPKAAKPTDMVAVRSQAMTWWKFAATVLPQALKIEYKVDTSRLEPYGAILTAVDPDAPPIIRWDNEIDRNPFSWYLYAHGSAGYNWNLSSGWVDVTGVTLQPSLWQEGHEYQGKSVFFILEGCKDKRYATGGLGLFPEILRGELREVRSTIEAYSRQGVLEGAEEATACGIRLQDGADWQRACFRVTTETGVTEYTLDRWD